MNSKEIMHLSLSILGYVLLHSVIVYLIPGFILSYKYYILIFGILLMMFSQTISNLIPISGSMFGFGSSTFTKVLLAITGFAFTAIAINTIIQPYVPAYRWWLFGIGISLLLFGGSIANKFFR